MVFVRFSTFMVVVFLASLGSAAPIPFQKRIAQTIAESTAQWEQACLRAGGASKCNPISQQAFTSLLAAAKNCDQQDAADIMIDLAKSLNNDSEMIRLSQIFVQQPRNAPDSLQVPYCQKVPKNPELNGLFHCQFAGSDFTRFSGDQTGNVPLGVAAVNPPGSCPAKLDGPVPDGVQLNTIANDPGAPSGQPPVPPPDDQPGDVDPLDAPQAAPGEQGRVDNELPKGVSTALPPKDITENQGSSNVNLVAPSPQTNCNAKSFTLANGQDAKTLNTKFARLTADSPCEDGKQACIGGQFGQCVGGRFILTPCGSGTQCFALPLVNSRGTSITCSSAAEAEARIALTGA